MKRTLILAIIAAVLPMMVNSCTTPRYVSTEPELNQSWTGHTFADIINTFGAPDRQVSNGDGGVILVYEDYTSQSVTTGNTNYWWGWHYPYMSPTYTTTTTTDRQYMNFYIGSDYKCYQVKTNYLKQDGREFSPAKTTVACAAGALVGAAVIAAACSNNRGVVYYDYGYDPYDYYYY